MDSTIRSNLHGQQHEQHRCNREVSASDGPIGHVGPCHKKVKDDSIKSESALLTCVVQGEVEAAGSSRGQTRAVSSYFNNSSLLNARNKKSNSLVLNTPEEGVTSKTKDSKGVRRGQNEGKRHVKKCEEVCTKMKDILAIKNFKVGELVWAKTDRRTPAWPAVIIDPQQKAPGVVLKACVMGAICVMYFGFKAGEIREYGWVKPGSIFGFKDKEERLKSQQAGKLEGRFRAAIDEATSYQPDENQPKSTEEAVEAASSSSLQQRSLSKVQYDGRATMVPTDIVETQAGEVLYINSSDISGCDNVHSRDSLPEELLVYCRNFKGVYLPREHLISCQCSSCMGKKITPCAFEKHSSSPTKNWKRAVKIEKTMELLNDWIESNNMGAQIKQSNAPTTARQKIDHVLQVASMPVLAKWTTEKCAICWHCGDSESDKMIICNRCLMAVHQNCYEAQDVDDITSWVCWACEKPQVKKDCCLCPIKGGVLKKTDVGDFWVHVTCAQFQPKVFISRDYAIGFRKVPLDSFGKTCVICEQAHGICTNCFMCSTYYHAMCGLRAGYRVELYHLRRHGREMSQFRSYCSNYTVIDFNAGLVETNITAEGVSSNLELPCNRERSSTSSVLADLPSTSNEEGSCARCRIYQKREKKRREEAVAHLVMGPLHHSLEVIEGEIGTRPPSEQDPITFATFEERLQHLKKNEDHIVCFGKSGIQGWGLFARRSIREGEMIIEYCGELIRPIVSDRREKNYQSQDKHCYVSDQVVIDATDKGSLAWFINHSCQPNCFARKLYMGETTRLVFVARENISAGQELM